MDLERSNAFRKRLQALKRLLLIDNISIYICTTGRFQRRFHLQVTINFVYEILIHFKGSCKESKKLFITKLALNLAWHLTLSLTQLLLNKHGKTRNQATINEHIQNDKAYHFITTPSGILIHCKCVSIFQFD